MRLRPGVKGEAGRPAFGASPRPTPVAPASGFLPCAFVWLLPPPTPATAGHQLTSSALHGLTSQFSKNAEQSSPAVSCRKLKFSLIMLSTALHPPLGERFPGCQEVVFALWGPQEGVVCLWGSSSWLGSVSLASSPLGFVHLALHSPL